MPVKQGQKKPRRGKQHPVRASAFLEVAEKLKAHANNDTVDASSPRAVLRLIADVFASVGKKVRKIVR